MTIDELLDTLRFEYHGWVAATFCDAQVSRIVDYERAPSFYDYLVSRGFSRHKLSAHGIGRDVQA